MDLSRDETKDEGARTTSPSGEVDDDKDLQKQRNDEDDDDEGTRQPYKCTFCRRGFPTAQALGGHMNVHRRHRGRSAVAGAAPPQGSSSYEQQSYYSSTTAAVVAFGQTDPASGASTAAGGALSSLHAERRRRPYELRLFGRDCAAAGRGREGGAGAGGDVRRDRCYARDDRDGGDHGGGGEELDLELRLGGAAGS
ncbi:unnamed protein product [Urochloa decumbens]|uniref:C2H2-type domain-containing protein n=1 Tax=Urochloa decumbens TaxID=240449 RepID=A0ABC9CIQ5_9POAL